MYFSGVVQGIGFRFTAKCLGDRYRVRGWVRNLADGRVELVAEGEPQILSGFLDDLKSEFKMQIREVEVKEEAFSGKYKNFQIAF